MGRRGGSIQPGANARSGQSPRTPWTCRRPPETEGLPRRRRVRTGNGRTRVLLPRSSLPPWPGDDPPRLGRPGGEGVPRRRPAAAVVRSSASRAGAPLPRVPAQPGPRAPLHRRVQASRLQTRSSDARRGHCFVTSGNALNALYSANPNRTAMPTNTTLLDRYARQAAWYAAAAAGVLGISSSADAQIVYTD